MLIPTYLERDLKTPAATSRPHVVTALSWDSFGGCQSATIESYGGAAELATMFNWLRYGVEVKDQSGRDVWQGYVSAVYVRNGPIEIGLTLDGMANSVQVAYSFVSPGTNTVGTRKITTAVTNADSIAEFGTIEAVISQGGLTDTAASDMAKRYLADHKFPMGAASAQGTGRPYGYMPAQRGTFASVRLECKGWIYTLGWRYANVTKTGPSFTDAAATVVNLGDNAARTYLMQQFTVSTTAIYTVGATVYVRKNNSPTDNLVVGIYALDGSGNPTGSALASGTYAAASLTTGGAWTRVTFGTPYTLSAGVQYGLQLSRSGAIDGTNYMRVNTDAGLGYAGGAFKVWDTSTWAAYSTDVDMIFRIEINALLETSQQIKDLETTYGDYITYTDIITASGVSVGANRDGDTTVYDVIRELCGYGGPNDRRLRVTVTPQRVMMIEEEEDAKSYAYYMDTSGQIMTVGESILPPYTPPVGRWIKIKDFIPGAGNPVYINNATVQFLEGADWSINSGLTPRFRGQSDISALTRLAGNGGYE